MRSRTASRHFQVTPAKPPIKNSKASAAVAAISGLRRHHIAARTIGPTGRARIGSPRSHRDRSSERARALGYRRPGSFSRHLRQITSRSRGTRGFSRDGGSGYCVRTMSSVSTSVVPVNGARPASRAYRIVPSP